MVPLTAAAVPGSRRARERLTSQHWLAHGLSMVSFVALSHQAVSH